MDFFSFVFLLIFKFFPVSSQKGNTGKCVVTPTDKWEMIGNGLQLAPFLLETAWPVEAEMREWAGKKSSPLCNGSFPPALSVSPRSQLTPVLSLLVL